VVLAGIGAVLFVVSALWLVETLPAEQRHSGGVRSVLGTFGRLVRDRTFIPYALSFGLAFGAMFTYIAGSPFVLEKIYGVSPQVFSLVFAINSACLVAATQVVHRVVERVGSPQLLRAGLLTTAAAGVALLPVVLAHGRLALVLTCLIVLVTGIGFQIPTGTALALAEQGWAAGSASALLGLGQFLVAALVAPLAGIAGQGTAVPMAVVIATLSVGGLAVELAFHGLRRPAPVRQPL
jgi:DHA1 family bicyclomycin/chloramphenicol resistance-like MFS transporter